MNSHVVMMGNSAVFGCVMYILRAYFQILCAKNRECDRFAKVIKLSLFLKIMTVGMWAAIVCFTMETLIFIIEMIHPHQ